MEDSHLRNLSLKGFVTLVVVLLCEFDEFVSHLLYPLLRVTLKLVVDLKSRSRTIATS